MGRAVGGAGAGCAGAGLLGVLVSVAIVVWLGSQSLGGGSSDGPDPSPRPTDPASLLTALDPPSVTVGDGTTVAVGSPTLVRATGLAPGSATVSVCALPPGWAPGDAVDAARCSAPLTATDAAADETTLEATVTFADQVATPTAELTCTTDPCWVVVQPPDGAPAGATQLLLVP